MRLSLLGHGETRAMIECYLKENGIYDFVEWHEEVPHEKLPEYYHSLNLFVLPSYYEGFGCVYIEAYACGVPFMCCEYQGAAEYIQASERKQWLVPPHDYKYLALLIEKQYKEHNVQHLCKDYDIDTLIKRYLVQLKTV